MNHLATIAISIGLLFGTFSDDTQQVQALDTQYIHAPTRRCFRSKAVAASCKKQALRNSDLLLVYGSSERAFDNPYHASYLFASYPTGFTVFPIGGGQTTSLIILEDVAAEADLLQGQKIVISMSPPFFFLHDRPPESYASDFSDLHLSSLVFSPDLTLATKQAARELEKTREMLKQDPHVALAVDRLASGSAEDLALYKAVLTCG